MSSRLLCAAALVPTLALALGGCVQVQLQPTPAPKLRPGSAEQIGPRLSNYGAAVVPPDGVISLWGDRFTGPGPMDPHATKHAPSLARDLAQATGLKVEDHSAPDQTAAEGLSAMTEDQLGAVVVLCYGYGDMATDVEAFKASLTKMVQLAHRRGVPVLMVIEPQPTPLPPPPPAAPGVTPTATPKPLSPANAKKQAYNNEAFFRALTVRAVAVAEGAGLVDAPVVLSDAVIGTVNQAARAGSVLTPAEKTPQSPLAQARIAHAIAADIEVGR